MEILDRYLQAVKQYLPKGQQDDIIQELSENLRSQMEDQEAGLGRPLTEGEQKAILERHGQPMVVAGRYRTDQRSFTFGRQLIGPVLFPIYLKILALNAGITLVLCVVVAIAVTNPGSILTISAIFFQLCLQFAIVTGIFILAESSTARFPDLLDSGGPLFRKTAVKDEGRIPRSQSITELIILTVLIQWWLAGPHYSRMMLGSADLNFTLGPGLRILFLALLPIWVAGWIQACVVLIRPRWVRFYSVARILTTSLFLSALVYSCTTGPWIVLAGSGRDSAGSGRLVQLVENVNHWFGIGLVLVGAGCLVQVALEVRRLLRLQRAHTPVALRAL